MTASKARQRLTERLKMIALARRRQNLEYEIQLAEMKAWRSLAGYKFMMFGYWAAVWVHLNKMLEKRRPNPWRPLVNRARRSKWAKP